jgi:hypothetical protein
MIPISDDFKTEIIKSKNQIIRLRRIGSSAFFSFGNLRVLRAFVFFVVQQLSAAKHRKWGEAKRKNFTMLLNRKNRQFF